jgi:hypothetical protein
VVYLLDKPETGWTGAFLFPFILSSSRLIFAILYTWNRTIRSYISRYYQAACRSGISKRKSEGLCLWYVSHHHQSPSYTAPPLGPPGQVAAVAGKKAGMKQGELAGILKELGYTEDQV